MFNKKINPEMFGDADKEIFRRAHVLRKNMTDCEKIIWEKLRQYRSQGVVFRRQHPYNNYILDFFCYKLKLAIEIDGDYHLKSAQKEKDLLRTNDLLEQGIQVLRFKNSEVLESIQYVISEIDTIVNQLK